MKKLMLSAPVAHLRFMQSTSRCSPHSFREVECIYFGDIVLQLGQPIDSGLGSPLPRSQLRYDVPKVYGPVKYQYMAELCNVAVRVVPNEV